MNLIGIFVLCVLSYCIGLQKGKDPNFFKHLFNQSPKKVSIKEKDKDKKNRPKSPVKKVVSFQQYKEKRK